MDPFSVAGHVDTAASTYGGYATECSNLVGMRTPVPISELRLGGLPTGTDLLDVITDAVDTINHARARRDQAMALARAQGVTWRAIAAAAGMTEHGVRKALERTDHDG